MFLNLSCLRLLAFIGALDKTSSWRVTNMGLLNIGRSEGTEIIQLFGRGIRLMGLNRSLKRSAMFAEERHPLGVELLERLNIFAIRANYMTQFREYIEREGIDPAAGEFELPLPIKQNKEFLEKGLIAPRLPKESRFADNERIMLDCDGAAKIVLDVAIDIEQIGSAVGVFNIRASVTVSNGAYQRSGLHSSIGNSSI